MKLGFSVTVVVTIRRQGLYIEDELVLLWHGMSDTVLLKLEVFREEIVRLPGCVYE